MFPSVKHKPRGRWSRALKERFPETLIAVSTITVTGQNFAREIFKHDAAKVFYFPFDWRWVVRRTLKAINPDAVVVMETELWPGFLRECKQQQIPVALVNGRLSEQSFRRYRLIKGFMTTSSEITESGGDANGS